MEPSVSRDKNLGTLKTQALRHVSLERSIIQNGREITRLLEGLPDIKMSIKEGRAISPMETVPKQDGDIALSLQQLFGFFDLDSVESNSILLGRNTEVNKSESISENPATDINTLQMSTEMDDPVACAATFPMMAAEQSLLQKELSDKKAVVEEVSALITAQRHNLLANPCTDSGRAQLAELWSELGAIDLPGYSNRGDALLDCVNLKIRTNEKNLPTILKDSESRYAQLGISKRLNRLNGFFKEVADLSLRLGRSANLQARLKKSVKGFQMVCDGGDSSSIINPE